MRGAASSPKSVDVAVVGAGVLGAWTALSLARRGLRVTLVEQHSPGHARSSSGGESRLIRCAHGDDAMFTEMARRSLSGWDELEEESGRRLLVRSGIAWFARREDGWEAASARTLAAAGIPAERLEGREAAALFPSLRTDDLAFVLHEPESGVLHARLAVQSCVEVAQRHGARVVTGRAEPRADGGVRITAADDEGRGGDRALAADRVVWACGPWLPRVLGAAVAALDLRVTKQDVTFFGADPRWATPPTPGWVDYDGAAYGLGDLDGRGVKCAPDVVGPDFDPDLGERVLSADNKERARAYLAHRFPALADAPLLGSRTCQYTLTPDTAFVIAPHPEHEGSWVVGGGSGHAFKHGPAVGAHVADLVTGAAAPHPRFALGPRRAASALRTAGGAPPDGGSAPPGAGPTGGPAAAGDPAAGW
jgi:sarcosine oxidase